MAQPPSLTAAPLAAVAAALRRRTISPLELVDAYQERIEPAADLRAFITPPGDQARPDAKRAQQQLARRQAGALLGVPIAVKDLFATRGLRTTAGSRILRDWVPPKEGGLGHRRRAPVPVFCGNTNPTGFANGVTTRNPGWGWAA